LSKIAENTGKPIAGGGTENYAEVSFEAQKGVEYLIQTASSSDSNWGLVALNWETKEPQSALRATILPTARAGKTDTLVTAFAAVINSSDTTATNCGVAIPASTNADFTWHPTDAGNNLTGSSETPVDIAAGAVQNYVFGMTPHSELHGQDVGVIFSCDNQDPAPSTSLR
jgi:hypothetical protein